MVQLFDGYYVIVDEYNFTLCKGEPKTKIRKDGKTEISHNVKGYYGSLTKAIKAFREELYRDTLKSRSLTFPEALRALQDVHTRVDQLLEEIEA